MDRLSNHMATHESLDELRRNSGEHRSFTVARPRKASSAAVTAAFQPEQHPWKAMMQNQRRRSTITNANASILQAGGSGDVYSDDDDGDDLAPLMQPRGASFTGGMVRRSFEEQQQHMQYTQRRPSGGMRSSDEEMYQDLQLPRQPGAGAPGIAARRTSMGLRISEDSYDFVSISGARRPSMRATEGNLRLGDHVEEHIARSGGGADALGRRSSFLPDGNTAAMGGTDGRRRSMRATDSNLSHLDHDPDRRLSATNGRRPSMRATEGNVDIGGGNDDHIERHIARTLAVAASRRRMSIIQRNTSMAASQQLPEGDILDKLAGPPDASPKSPFSENQGDSLSTSLNVGDRSPGAGGAVCSPGGSGDDYLLGAPDAGAAALSGGSVFAAAMALRRAALGSRGPGDSSRPSSDDLPGMHTARSGPLSGSALLDSKSIPGSPLRKGPALKTFRILIFVKDNNICRHAFKLCLSLVRHPGDTIIVLHTSNNSEASCQRLLESFTVDAASATARPVSVQRLFVPLNDGLLIDMLEEQADKLMPDLLVTASEGLSDPIVVGASAPAPGGVGAGSVNRAQSLWATAAQASGGGGSFLSRMASMKAGGVGGGSGSSHSTSLAVAKLGLAMPLLVVKSCTAGELFSRRSMAAPGAGGGMLGDVMAAVRVAVEVSPSSGPMLMWLMQRLTPKRDHLLLTRPKGLEADGTESQAAKRVLTGATTDAGVNNFVCSKHVLAESAAEGLPPLVAREKCDFVALAVAPCIRGPPVEVLDVLRTARSSVLIWQPRGQQQQQQQL